MKTFVNAFKDRDTLVLFLDRFIMALKGPLVIMAVLFSLNVQEQGIWYTFISLSALSGIVELGFTSIITQFVSHEYAYLKKKNGFLIGKRNSIDRAFGLVRYALKFYLYIVPLAVVLLVFVGIYFFENESDSIKLAWIIYCIFNGVNLFVSLLQAIYKGFDNIYEIHLTIAYSNLVSLTVIVVGLLLGGGVFTLPLSIAFYVLTSVILLKRYAGKLCVQIYKHNIINIHSWKEEIITLQSKYAVSFLCGYFIFNLYVPIAYKYQGDVVAGQLGLSITIVKAISTFCYVWLFSKLPKMNMLAAKGERVALYKLFKERSLFTLVTYIVGVFAIMLLVYLASYFEFYNSRILSFSNILLLCFSELSVVLMSIYAIYVRAHKLEPFNIPSIITALSTGAIVFISMQEKSIYHMYIYVNLFQWLIMLPLFFYFGKEEMNKYYFKKSKGL